MKSIYTLAEMLAAIPSADILTWHGPDRYKKGELELMHDDYAAGRRIITTVTIYPKTARITRRILKDYDAQKHSWNTYGQAPEPIETDTKGKKALLAEIQRRAKEKTGWPNPAFFTTYPKTEDQKQKPAPNRYALASY